MAELETVEIESPKGGNKINRPSAHLLGSVKMMDDLIQPAVPECDWNALNEAQETKQAV
jgi:hypothetical protein